MKQILLPGLFGPKNQERVEQFLDKLLPYVNIDSFILCGSAAIQFGLQTRGVASEFKDDFNDIDALTKNIHDINPSVQKDFLIYHYHDYSNKPGHNDDFFIVLVDPVTKIKIDIFSYNPYIPISPSRVSYKTHKLSLRCIEDQLATQVLETTGVFNGGKVPPKWLSSLESMWKVADKNRVNKYFVMKKANIYTQSCEDVYKEILVYLAKHPEQIVAKSSRRALYKCEHCEDLNDFTVAPMDEIYKILGYVE